VNGFFDLTFLTLRVTGGISAAKGDTIKERKAEFANAELATQRVLWQTRKE